VGLIFLPRAYPAPNGLAEEVALRLNGFYRARSLVYYVHPFLVLTAAWGVVARKFQELAGAVATGFLFCGCRGFGEALQQVLSLVALHLNWREGYARAADPALRETYQVHLLGFGAVRDSLYLLLLTGFAVAHILYGIATWSGSGLERVLLGIWLWPQKVAKPYF
jgi:hypothetical protein